MTSDDAAIRPMPTIKAFVPQWRDALYLFVLAIVFANVLIVLDMSASTSHKAARIAMSSNARVASSMGRIGWAYPIFFSYKSVTPPFKDCENGGYLVWTDRGFGFVGVRLRRKTMYQDPWDVYSVSVGYSEIPGPVSSTCTVEFAQGAVPTS